MFTIGIDLGTTTCSMYYFNNNKPTVIPNSEFNKTTPSYIGIKENGEILVGDPALNEQAKNPNGTVYMFKRFIGRKFSEVINKDKLMYKIVEHTNGDSWVQLHNKKYSPIELSSILLKKLVNDAEKFLQGKVTKCVITVPAYFNDAQRQATKEAGQLAGLEVLRIVNEPTAACLANDVVKGDNKTVAVYDLGGGTFDISILEINDGVVEVLSTYGDTTLGGEDATIALSNYVINQFKEQTGIDVSSDPVAKYKLKEYVEKAKLVLDTRPETKLSIPYFQFNKETNTPIHLDMTLSQTLLNDILKTILDKTFKYCDEALVKADIKLSDVTDLILAGGPTKNPFIKETVDNWFKCRSHHNIDPVDAVGMGASIQAGILGGDVKNLMLLDVLPIALGIDTAGGIFVPIIEGNATIPCSKSQVFSTNEDNQESVDVMVYQGERKLSSHNIFLGKVKLDGITKAPKGIPQIQVTFKADSNGIIDVYAEDLASKNKVNTKITPNSGLSKDEIEKIKEDAKSKEELDGKFIEKKGLQTKVRDMIYQADKENLTEFKQKVQDDNIFKKYFIEDSSTEETIDRDLVVMNTFVTSCEENLKSSIEKNKKGEQEDSSNSTAEANEAVEVEEENN